MMSELKFLMAKFENGDIQALARIISVVENELDSSEEILSSLKIKDVPLIGFTGPPGAGKSTLINVILKQLTGVGKKIAVIAIDPSSPFHQGALLGDRLRMAEHFMNEKVYIRSLATRGSLGGLSSKIIEVTDILRAFPFSASETKNKGEKEKHGFDYVFIETVGVGQNEVQIAGLADITILVLSPGYGDGVQTLKAGILEIGDVFVINKSDLPGADAVAKNIEQLVRPRHAPVIKAVATEEKGVEEIITQINECSTRHNDKKIFLLTEKIFQLIQNKRMKNVDKKKLQKEIEKEMKKHSFNLYRFANSY